jgi:hypothetical protein
MAYYIMTHNKSSASILCSLLVLPLLYLLKYKTPGVISVKLVYSQY